MILPVLVFVGCVSNGETSYEKKTYYKDGQIKSEEYVESESPNSPVNPASIQKDNGNVKTSTGNTQAIDHVMSSITSYSSWAGILLIVIGLVMTLGASYIPMVTFTKGLIVMGVGVGMLFLPNIINRYSWVIVLSGIGIVIFLFADDIERYYREMT